MQLYNQHRQVNLIIPDGLIGKLTSVGIRNYPHESGGFLMGYYSEDKLTLHIADFLLPIKDKKTRFFFERSVQGLKEKLYRLFQTKGHFYIGEWHTHPNGLSMYSQTDLNAMIEIANCDTVNITNPILLILSIGKNQLNDFSIYLYDKKGLYRYE